jgi:hypothetical protein
MVLKQPIKVAMAEKPEAPRTEQALGGRAARADRSRTLAALARIGQGNPPMDGDESPDGTTDAKTTGSGVG